jgi:hypothetical protein
VPIVLTSSTKFELQSKHSDASGSGGFGVNYGTEVYEIVNLIKFA